MNSVRNLSVWFDVGLSFGNHVKKVCRSCFTQMCDIGHVRKYLACEAAILAHNAFVGSILGYCDSLFTSLFKSNTCI